MNIVDQQQQQNAAGRPPPGPHDADDTLPATSVPTDFRSKAEHRANHGHRTLKLFVGLGLIISLLSLALSTFLLYRLLAVRQTTAEALDAAINTLDGLAGDGFHYEYHFERMIPVSATIPIEQELSIPFEGTLPINTAVEVPINTGLLGTIVVDVPIETDVYVNTEVPVRIEETFRVSTTIPVSMTIPIELQPDEPGLQSVLGKVLEWLIRLRGSF